MKRFGGSCLRDQALQRSTDITLNLTHARSVSIKTLVSFSFIFLFLLKEKHTFKLSPDSNQYISDHWC